VPQFGDQRYTLLNQVGIGSMGVVYRALDRLTGNYVALKKVGLLPREPNPSSYDLRLELTREFKALASLRHPNVVTVLDYGFDSTDTPFLVMELLDSAQTISTAGQHQPRDLQIQLLLQVLQALTYMHRRGMIHRDLKPSNILVTGGQVRVLDFGLAIGRGQSKDTVGTLSYMAPEVLTGHPADIASDLYSFGMVACEMLAGRHPFRRVSTPDDTTLIPSQLAEMTLRMLPEAMTEGLESPIAAILIRLLQKNPADRYENAEAISEAFRALLPSPPPRETTSTRESFLQAAQFIGREHELALLSQALGEAAVSKGHIWLVGGESGVGKSRLIDELRVYALVEGAQVLRGQAMSEGGQPYQVWRDVLRGLALQTPLSDLEASVLKPQVSDIEGLLGRPIAEAPHLDPQPTHDRFMSVVEAVLTRQGHPILIVLEDLQWSGSEGIALLMHLSRKVRTHPLLIVSTYRDDEPVNFGAESEVIQHIKLNRLTEADIARLSESMLGTAGQNPEVLKFLQHETEGNIFFLIEVVRALAEEAGQLDAINAAMLPASVSTRGVTQFIQRRLARVSPEAQPLLRLAAVLGRDLDLKVLEALKLGGKMAGDVLPWLRGCADAGVLEVVGDRWRFAHDKLRETLLSQIPAEARPALHEQVAVSLEQTYPGASGYGSAAYANALVYHWGQVGNTERICYYAALTGEQALQNGAYKEARSFLEQALRYATGNMTPFQAANAEYQLGMANYGLSNMEASRAAMSRALKLLGWPAPQRPNLLYRDLLKAVLFHVLPPLRLVAQYTRADSESLLLASRVCARLVEIGFFSGEILPAALETFRTVNFAEAAGPSPELARSYAHLTIAMGLIPSDRLAQHYVRQALRVANAVDRSVTLAYCLYTTAYYQTNVAHWDKADAAFRESLHLFSKVGDKRLWREAQANLGYTLGLEAKFAESIESRKMLLESAEHDDDTQARGWAIAGLGEMSMWLHRTEDALHYLKARIALMNDYTDVLDPSTPAYALLALTYWRANQQAEARQAAQVALDHLAVLKDSAFHSYHAFASLAELYLQFWEAEPDNPALAESVQRVNHRLWKFARRFPVYHAWALRNEGTVQWLSGNKAKAWRAWQRSLELAVRLHMPLDEGLVLYEIARHQPVDHPKRRSNLIHAAALFALIETPYERARTQALLI
jgi:tetratricopeptide (TPR) repeat protein